MDYIKRIRTPSGDKQIDYNALANLPEDLATTDDLKKASIGMRAIEITSEDGITYVGTIDGLTELTNGLTITVIPNMANTDGMLSLNINGLGLKDIFQSSTSNDGDYLDFREGSFEAGVACQFVYTYNSYRDDYVWLSVRPILDLDGVSEENGIFKIFI